MSDSEELEAARRLITQLHSSLEKLGDGIEATLGGVERLATTLRTSTGSGNTLAREVVGILETISKQLRLDRDFITTSIEHIEKYGFTPKE